MNTPIPIALLDVVGYATSLSEAMVPTIVTPVFRVRGDEGRPLFPPFVIHCGQVCDGTLGTAKEFERFAEDGDITEITPPIPAQANYELWIDADMVPQYDPIDVANETLGKIAAEHINSAELALQRGAVEEADRLAGVALCADDRRLEPLAIRAAIRHRQGREGAVKLMAQLATPPHGERVFDTMMKCYGEMIPTEAPVHSSVYHVSAVKPEEQLGCTETDRAVVLPAREAAAQAQASDGGHDGICCGAAVQLASGQMVTGKNSMPPPPPYSTASSAWPVSQTISTCSRSKFSSPSANSSPSFCAVRKPAWIWRKPSSPSASARPPTQAPKPPCTNSPGSAAVRCISPICRLPATKRGCANSASI